MRNWQLSRLRTGANNILDRMRRRIDFVFQGRRENDDSSSRRVA
jgi:hypothetical protein